jgi:molecular chaperone DnaK
MYALGIDLGTTYTAAATWRDGRAQIVSLGDRTAAIPSVVLLRADETFLTGEAANRRGLTEPQRVAREFKRRLGDTTPLMLGGSPYSAEALMSQLLRAVVTEVTTREGGAPSSVCVSHPANWGPYKIDLLRQAARMADLPSVSFVSEPEAAAVNYAAEQRLGVGAVVAVYDLGGGTFDAAVLRRTAGGFAILGQPEGIERLGGIDFDAAVFNHVRTTLGDKLDDLDDDDPSVIAAVARLREECVQAKEALSSDTDTSIPVLLPTVTTEVRLTRGELESMVRPALHGSIEALRRAVRSAELTPEQLHAVLLVGGSSRMPLVGQLVSAELGRPVAVDTHPKHAVALGAARLAGGGFSAPGPARGAGVAGAAGLAAGAAAVGAPSVDGSPAGGGAAGRGAPGAGLGSGPGTGGGFRGGPAGQSAAVGLGAGGLGGPPTAGRTVPVDKPAGQGFRQGPGTRPPAEAPGRTERFVGGAATERAAAGMTGPGRSIETGFGRPPANRARQADTGTPPRGVEQVAPPSTNDKRRRRMVVISAAVGAVVLLAGVGVGLALTNRGEDDTNAGAADQSTSTATSAIPADEQCTDAIMSNPRWVCLTSAIIADGKITIDYRSDGSQFSVNGGYHLHVYGGDGVNPPAEIEGMQAPEAEQGKWYVEDRRPAVLDVTDQRFVMAIGEAPKVCARIADAGHHLVPDPNGAFVTGNCVPITRTTETTTTTTPVQPTHKKKPTRTTTTTESTTTTDDSTTTTTTTSSRVIIAPTENTP